MDGHVRLAPVTVQDADELTAANRAARDHHAPWAEPCTDRAGFDAWLGRMLTGPCVHLVARDAAGALVGVVSLNEIVLGAFRSCCLGYYGYPGAAGRGLMSQAVALALDHAFGALGLHRAEANIQPGNRRSLALVQRLGFRREGFSPAYLRIAGAWRDHERWAILAEEHGRRHG